MKKIHILNYRFYSFWVVLFLFNIHSVIGQNTFKLTKDTLRAPFECNYFTNVSTPLFLKSVDRDFIGLQWYNLLQNNGDEYQSVANLGTAAMKIKYSPTYRNGFGLGLNKWELYRLNTDNIRYYKTNKPMVDLDFLFGAHGNVMVNVNHTQNISKNDNYGIQYRRIASTGAYKNSETLLNSTTFYNHYFSKKGKYSNKFEVLMNEMKARENGGLINEIPNFGGGTQKAFENVNLNAATIYNYDVQLNLINDFYLQKMDTTKSNLYKRNHFSNTLFYKNEHHVFQDVHPDTVYHSNITNFENQLEFFHHRHAIGTQFNYTQFADFSHWKWIKDTALKQLILSPQIEFEQMNCFAGDRSDTAVNYFNTNLSFVLTSQNQALKIVLNKAITGYNIRDYNIDIKIPIVSSPLKYGVLTASFNQFSKTPDYYLQHFQSKHLNWNNDFRTIKCSQLTFEYALPTVNKNMFSAVFNRTENAVYFDSSLTPHQDSIGFQLLTLEYKSSFLSKHFGYSADILYQATSSTIISIPKFWTKVSLFYHGKLFKQNMQIQIGTDIRYNTKYYAYQYSPFVSNFYIQSQVFNKTAPILDIFFNVKIKTLSLCLKMNDVLEGIIQQAPNYQFVNYPTQGRGFDVYLSWRFLN